MPGGNDMKRLISLVLCAVLLWSLSGCRQEPLPTESKDPTQLPTPAPTQGVVEEMLDPGSVALEYDGVQLQFWSMLQENDPEAKVYLQAAEYFRRTTGAQVQFNWLGGKEADLAEALAGDLQADIFEITGDSLGNQFLPYALELTEYATRAEYADHSWEKLTGQVQQRCSGLYGIPHRPVLYGMYYNRGRLEETKAGALPDTWSEFLEFSQMLKDRGYEALVIDDARANLILELHMERALGWENLRETMLGEQWRKNEMAMTVIQNAIQFAEMGYLVKGNPASYPSGQNRLAQSNAVMVAGSNLLCAQVENATAMDVSWGVFPYPGDGPGTGLLLDAQVLAVNRSCTKPQAAFDFTMLLATGEFDQLRADVAGGIPADPANVSMIYGANKAMETATAQAPKWFRAENNLLFTRLWNGYYKTGAYFADQLNKLSNAFESEKNVG